MSDSAEKIDLLRLRRLTFQLQSVQPGTIVRDYFAARRGMIYRGRHVVHISKTCRYLWTNGYWSRRKEELVSLCESRPPQLWWTLSAADLHWPDLRRFVSDPAHAPHLVDAWFTLRVQEYVKWFFGDDCEWIWWRNK